MSEQTDPVREVEDFLIIFAVVHLVSLFIRLLCRPFQGIGFKGWLLGLLAVPLLLIGLSFEVLSFVHAKDVYDMDCITVTAPIANLRSTTEVTANNIVRKAKRGDRFCNGTASYALHPKWMEIKNKEEKVYIHKSVVYISEKKNGTDRDSTWDTIFFVTLGFYILCAIASWQEGKKERKLLFTNRSS